MKHPAFVSLVCVASLLGCVARSGQEDQASALEGAEQQQQPAAVACHEPAAGCACAGNQAPIRCAPDDASLRDAGPSACLEGTRYCRQGRWGACEQIVSYEPQKHAERSGLVDPTAQHAKCSDCDPSCFRVPDNFDPADGPLDSSFATGLKYHSSGAGVTLTPGVSLPIVPLPDGGVPAGSLFLSMADGLIGTDTHTSRANPTQSQVYLLFDRSLSMAEENQWLYDSFDTGSVVDPAAACTDGDQTLAAAGISGALRCLTRDPQVGVGMFRDLPFEPYATDQSLPAPDRSADALREIAYANVRAQTSDLTQVKLGLTEMSIESSGDPDVASSQIPALYAVATGQGMFMGIERAAVPDATCASSAFGYPCFPGGSKPVVVLVTDSPFHNGPNPGSYPYDYNPADLTMQQGTTAGLTSIPLGTNDWGSAYMVADDAATSLNVFRGSTTAMSPAVSPSIVGCLADSSVGDAVVRFNLGAPGHVNLSTAQSSFPTSLAVFNGAVPGPLPLSDADHGNELFSSAYDMGNADGRELVVHGDTSDPATTGDMVADYQASLFGAACAADTRAPDAVFKFSVPIGADSPTNLELSLDMGPAHAVLSVYEAGAGPLPRWPAQQSPPTAAGNINTDPGTAYKIPSGAGNEYVSVIGDTSALTSSYDTSVLGGSECNPDPSSKDAAFTIHVDGTHRLRFDTEGSSFDTVLSLHSEPPMTKTGNARTWTAAETHNNHNENAATSYATGPINGRQFVFEGDTLGMASDVTDTFGCGLDNACHDAVYMIEISERTTVRLQVSGTGYQPGLVVTRADPARVSGRYTALALGGNHSCALSGGRVFCWGADDVGQLGDGGAAGDPDSGAPVQVAAITDALQIAAGGNHSCAVTSQGNVYCWGAGGAGQLGDGNSSDRYAPVEVQGGALSDVAQVACGDTHCCALLHSGGVRCWGDNAHGQLGDAGAVTQSALPVAVVSAEVFEQIAANDDHTCAIRASDDAVFCWGSGAYGKLGNGDTADSSIPVQVGGSSGARYLMLGQDHSCAVQSNGHVSCWGRGEGGRLGRGDDVTDHSTAGDVLSSDGTPLVNVKASFAAGRAHSCVAMLTGLVQCWGDNSSFQLGNTSAAPSLLATPTYDILDAVQVVASAEHSCALRADGSLMCWGDGAHGKLGDGGSAPVPRPVPAHGGAGVQVGFGTGTLDAAFSETCGAITQAPEAGCLPASDGVHDYFFCDDHPRTFAGAAQACAAVGYQLAGINATGENPFVAAGRHGPTWIGEKRRSTPDWLNLSPALDFEDLDGNPVWHTEQIGNDDCSSGICIWVPTQGFFLAPTFDLIDSEPWTPASTWIGDDQPSPALGQNCATLDPSGKWATDNCAALDPLAPWLPDPSSLVANSLAGRLAAPDFAGGVEHDYACELRVPYTDVTLDPGKYYITVKGGDDGVSANQCDGPYALHIDDLGSPTGGYITCSDDAGPATTASAIERTLTTGDYYLVLKGRGASDEGPYTLSVRDLDAVHTSEIACDAGGGPGDPATFSFAATPGKSYYALVKGTGPFDKGAYTLDVRDQGRSTRLACDAGSAPDGASVLSLDLDAGSYYAVVTGRDMTAAGEYRLTLGGAPAVSTTFVPPSYTDTLAALTAAKIRVATVLSCDVSNASCADAKAQADQLATDTRGLLRVAASAADVPAELVKAIQLLESLDTLSAQLLFTPDSDPGFANPRVVAIADPSNGCMPGSDGMSFASCQAGAKPSFSVSLKNPALNPVPPASGPLGAYQFTLRVTGIREGDTVFSEDVPVLVVPTGAAPPMTYTSGSYHQDFESSGCVGNQQASWDRLGFDVDVLPDTAVHFYACSADASADLSSCFVGAPSSGYQRVVTISAGSGSGIVCSAATQDTDCPGGYCSPYSNICNYLEGATCTQDAECPGTALGRCHPGPSVATLGYTCDVNNLLASPASALHGDDYRPALRVKFDLDSLGDGSRTPSVFFWEAQYQCRNVE